MEKGEEDAQEKEEKEMWVLVDQFVWESKIQERYRVQL